MTGKILKCKVEEYGWFRHNLPSNFDPSVHFIRDNAGTHVYMESFSNDPHFIYAKKNRLTFSGTAGNSMLVAQVGFTDQGQAITVNNVAESNPDANGRPMRLTVTFEATDRDGNRVTETFDFNRT